MDKVVYRSNCICVSFFCTTFFRISFLSDKYIPIYARYTMIFNGKHDVMSQNIVLDFGVGVGVGVRLAVDSQSTSKSGYQASYWTFNGKHDFIPQNIVLDFQRKTRLYIPEYSTLHVVDFNQDWNMSTDITFLAPGIDYILHWTQNTPVDSTLYPTKIAVRSHYSVSTKGLWITGPVKPRRSQSVAETLAITLRFHFSQESAMQLCMPLLASWGMSQEARKKTTSPKLISVRGARSQKQ
jgi:hypothetical protein